MSETTIDKTARTGAESGLAGDIAGAFKGTSWDSVGATVVINLLSLVLPLTLMQVYDRIVPNAAFSTLTLLALGAGAAMLLEAIYEQDAVEAYEPTRVEVTFQPHRANAVIQKHGDGKVSHAAMIPHAARW